MHGEQAALHGPTERPKHEGEGGLFPSGSRRAPAGWPALVGRKPQEGHEGKGATGDVPTGDPEGLAVEGGRGGLEQGRISTHDL